MVAISAALVICQPVLAGTFCTLCLCSAGISFVVAALVGPEVLATVRLVRDRRRTGSSLRAALTGSASE
jgi:hypothetical protein